jgi:SAM-dependent methyltransferase
MPDRPRLTERAQQAWRPYLRPGSWAIDATAGNGHDTVFIAQAVSPGGHVFAFDIQNTALRATARRLESAGLLDTATLICADHARLPEHLPCSAKGRIGLVSFNLGYLPTGDHSRTTRPETTLPALQAALGLLAPQGALSIMAYRGHPGGMQEAEAVEDFMTNLQEPWTVLRHEASGTSARPGPVWWLVGRIP